PLLFLVGCLWRSSFGRAPRSAPAPVVTATRAAQKSVRVPCPSARARNVPPARPAASGAGSGRDGEGRSGLLLALGLGRGLGGGSGPRGRSLLSRGLRGRGRLGGLLRLGLGLLATALLDELALPLGQRLGGGGLLVTAGGARAGHEPGGHGVGDDAGQQADGADRVVVRS